jgi:hypothetical protein
VLFSLMIERDPEAPLVELKVLGSAGKYVGKRTLDQFESFELRGSSLAYMLWLRSMRVREIHRLKRLLTVSGAADPRTYSPVGRKGTKHTTFSGAVDDIKTF